MGQRKIAKKDRVIDEIKQVLSRRLRVESQEELCELVLTKLKKEDKSYALTPQRVKRLALTLPEVEVKAKTKKMPKIEKIGKCPICGSLIVPLKGRNLLNKQILIGYKCVNCAYQCDLEAFMPMKYLFLWKPDKEKV